MAQDPKKVAPRTLMESERIKAEKLYRRWLNAIMAKIRRIIAGATSAKDLKKKLRDFAESKAFFAMCKQAARQTVTMLSVGQMHSWRAAATVSLQGRKIYKALQKELKSKTVGKRVQAIIDENAKLIKTVPQNIANQFSHMSAEKQFAGMRPEELMEEFKNRAPHLTDVEARRIARTESGKAATALLQARCEDLGISFYTWYSCQDKRVRDSHRHMHNVICAWNDPPDPESLNNEKSYGHYHPRGIFNCRCDALPVIDLSDINFPARVHRNGRITPVNNLREFERLMGINNGGKRD